MSERNHSITARVGENTHMIFLPLYLLDSPRGDPLRATGQLHQHHDFVLSLELSKNTSFPRRSGILLMS